MRVQSWLWRISSGASSAARTERFTPAHHRVLRRDDQVPAVNSDTDGETEGASGPQKTERWPRSNPSSYVIERARGRARPLALPGSHPPNADVRLRTQPIGELRRVMLEVPDVHELVLELGHPVRAGTRFQGCPDRSRPPRCRPSARRRSSSPAPGFSYRGPEPAAACFLIGGTREPVRMLDVVLVLLPRSEGGLVRLEVQVGEVERVVGDLPERVDMSAVAPHGIGTSPNRFAKHRESGVILTFQDGSKRVRGSVSPTACLRSGMPEATSVSVPGRAECGSVLRPRGRTSSPPAFSRSGRCAAGCGRACRRTRDATIRRWCLPIPAAPGLPR